MTLQEFIVKYNGKAIDFDGAYGNQCVDLMNQYIVEVLGIQNPIQTFPGDTAYNIYKNANDSRFTKISNTPTGVPSAGDIIFWNTTIGSAGHVAVFISGDANSFTSFDQNWPVGSLCHEQAHDYKGVAGWLHFNQVDTQSIIDDLRKERDANWQLHLQDQQTISERDKTIQDLQHQLQSLRTAFDLQTKADQDTGAQLLEVSHERDLLKSTLEATQKALQSPTASLKDILASIDSLKSASDEIAKKYLELQKAFEDSAIFKRIPKKTLSIWEKIKGLFIK